MEYFKIVTDSTADLPESFLAEHHIGLMHLSYTFGEDNYGGTTGRELSSQEFYNRIRNGEMPVTSQVNPDQATEKLEEYLLENHNILYLAFSSGLSGTYNSVVIAAQEMAEKYPESNIMVLDTLCASLGEGLLVYYAVKMQQEGRSLEQTYEWLSSHRQNLVHIFTVDDLFHLYRGGRVSKTTAAIGVMIHIKPILHVDVEGHLVALSKTRGRKKSLHELVDYMEKHMGTYRDQNEMIMISHSDCYEDAVCVRDEIEKRFGFHQFVINSIGQTIGSHTGIGTVALFFLGEGR
ncbi:MAG: DegV family protein [Lachnospiraceae bacterium]|nr:DegV family protein [Lachnospiraceae bacterium]